MNVARIAAVMLLHSLSLTTPVQSAPLKPLFTPPSHGNCSGFAGGLVLSATATPDLGGIAPSVLVVLNTSVSMFGIAEDVKIGAHCKLISETPVPFKWSVSLRGENGLEADATSLMKNTGTLAPSFTPSQPGVYAVNLTANSRTVSTRIETVRQGHGWVSIGPSGFAGGSNSVDVGRANNLVFDPAHNGVMYVSTAWGGIFRSENFGIEWHPMMDNKNLVHLGTGPMAISGDGTLFVGQGDEHPGTNLFDSASSLLFSSDQGLTWQSSSSAGCTRPATDQISGTVTRIFAGGRLPKQVVVSTLNGMLRSTDGGQCWQLVPGLDKAGQFTDLNFDPRFDDTLWVGEEACGTASAECTAGKGGVALVSKVWSDSPVIGGFYNPTKSNVGWVEIARAPSNPATVYFAISNGVKSAKIVRTETDTNGQTQLAAINGSQCSDQCNYGLALAVHPLNDRHLLFGEVGMHHSTNGGSSYGGLANNGSAHADVHSIVFPPNDPTQAFAATDGGVFRLSFSGRTFQTPAKEWEARNSYLNTSQALSFSSSPNDLNLVSAGVWDDGSMERSTERNWRIFRGGDGAVVSYDASTSKRIYVNKNAYQGSATIRYPDGASRGSPAAFEANPFNPGELWGQRILGKHDTGAYFWHSGWRCGDPAPGPNRFVTGVDFTQDGHYFIAADDGTIFRIVVGGAQLLSKCGQNTPLVNPQLVFGAGSGTRANVAVDPFDTQSAYAIFPTPSTNANRVVHLVHTDQGWTPIPIAVNLPNTLTLNVAIAPDPKIQGIVYVGSTSGLWAGTPQSDGTYNWTREQDVPETTVEMILPQRGPNGYSGILRAATFGRGIWERATSPVCASCSPVQSLPRCPACVETQRSATIESDTDLLLRVSLTNAMRRLPTAASIVQLQVTPMAGGKSLGDFLSRAGLLSADGIGIAQLSYLPSRDGPDSLSSDHLLLRALNREGEGVGAPEVIPYPHQWYRRGMPLLRIETDTYGPGKMVVPQLITVAIGKNRAHVEKTPIEIPVPLRALVDVRFTQKTSSSQCFLNGEPLAQRSLTRFTITRDSLLRCGTMEPERD